MQNENQTDQKFPLEVLELLGELRQFGGPASEFWDKYNRSLIKISKSLAGAICLRDENSWKILSFWPNTGNYQKFIKALYEELDACALMCQKKGLGIAQQSEATITAVPLNLNQADAECLALFYQPKISTSTAVKSLQVLKKCTDFHRDYARNIMLQENQSKSEGLLTIMDIGFSISSQKRFLQAAMTLCNELSNRFHCERVSFGIHQKGYLRVKAVSHADSFEKKMDVIQSLESVMEEAWDQNKDLFWPGNESGNVLHQHQAYAGTVQVPYLLTILLRNDGENFGAVVLERSEGAFSESDLSLLDVARNQISPKMFDLWQSDRWFGSTLTHTIRDTLAKILGFEHTWWKLAAVLFSLFLLFSLTIPIGYRLRTTMILRTDKLFYITAPFEGYIDSVFVEPGDELQLNDTLLVLDDNELLIKEAELISEAQMYSREIQKYRASASLADIRIAQAKLRQTRAMLKNIRYRLDKSLIKSQVPGRSVVVSGDLEKKQGAPVKAGEELFRIARIEDIFSEIHVEELEIQNIREGMTAEIALKSRPETVIPVQIVKIHPAAEVRDQKNVFIVRAEFSGKKPEWLRPGMTGVSRINAGNKTLWWILTHQAFDFLRLKLWW